MQTFGIVLIIIALLGLYGIFHITVYNKMIVYKTKINHVEGLIDNSLREKFDLIIRAEETIKENLKTKKDYLSDYKELKNEKISNFDLDRKLKEAESIIENLYNDHEELNNNENLKEILKELKNTNEKLTAGITYYNKQTSKLNAYTKKFPNNIISKIHHVKQKAFFDGKDLNDDDNNDFKL